MNPPERTGTSAQSSLQGILFKELALFCNVFVQLTREEITNKQIISIIKNLTDDEKSNLPTTLRNLISNITKGNITKDNITEDNIIDILNSPTIIPKIYTSYHHLLPSNLSNLFPRFHQMLCLRENLQEIFRNAQHKLLIYEQLSYHLTHSLPPLLRGTLQKDGTFISKTTRRRPPREFHTTRRR